MKEKILGYSLNDQETSTIKTTQNKNWKFYLIISGGILLILILITIIIVVLVNKSEDSNNNNDNEKEDDEEYIPSPDEKIGDIICIFDIYSNSDNTQLLGNEFTKKSLFNIYVDKKLIKYSK